MTQEELDIEWIEKYYRGLLTETELEDFREREKGDVDFADRVRSYRDIFEGIEYYGKQKEFAETLASWEQELKTSKKNEFLLGSVRISKPALAIAATVALLMIPLATWWLSFDSPDPRFEPYEDITKTRSGSNESPSAEGMDAYNRHEYRSSARLLKAALAGHPDDFIILFYLGESYQALNESDSARLYYQKGLKLEDNPLIEVTEWRIALTYLRDDDLPALKTQLEKILSDKTHTYHSEAEALYSEYWKPGKN